MALRPPGSTRTDTLFPCPHLSSRVPIALVLHKPDPSAAERWENVRERPPATPVLPMRSTFKAPTPIATSSAAQPTSPATIGSSRRNLVSSPFKPPAKTLLMPRSEEQTTDLQSLMSN